MSFKGEDEEKINFLRVYLTFKSYREQAMNMFRKKELAIKKLPTYQKEKLKNHMQHLNKLQECLETNDAFIQLITKHVHHIFANEDGYAEYLALYSDSIGPYSLDKLIVVFKQLVREWCKEGQNERTTSFQPIIEEIQNEFPHDKMDLSKVKILFPGAGLGRLPFELAIRGYTCEGNDYSLFMLFIANFILNRAGRESEECTLFPYIHTFDNLMFNNDQLISVSLPDAVPMRLLQDDSRISMSCGDFIEIYSKKSCEFDCVATCFFIDCPPNIVLVVEIIHNILIPGGIWINNGPLQYHFDEDRVEDPIQLSREDLRNVISHTGMYFKKEKEITATYSDIPRSMSRSQYHNWFFVCQKPKVRCNSPA